MINPDPAHTPESHPLQEIGADETIAAIATGSGAAGIGIVRISGNRALHIAQALFHPARGLRPKGPGGNHFLPHHLHYGHVCDPHNGRMIDEVLLSFMPAPRSYTREDVVEIQSHGGVGVLGRVLGLVLQSGARLAEPGEFTRRAFLNGRLDLTQAEAVADIVLAANESALEMAAVQLKGGLKERIHQILAMLDEMTAGLEASIEFPEEVDAPLSREEFEHNLIRSILTPIQQLHDSYAEGRILREGLRIAIAGRPNVGKSSLLNQLIHAEKAIVTPLPGTTRDPVEAGALCKGMALWFVDTAGIRSSEDLVESMGIRKSREAIESADLVLLMIDAAQPIHPGDGEILDLCRSRKVLLVLNKIDLVEGRPIGLPLHFQGLPACCISALQGTGIDALKERVVCACAQASVHEGGVLVANIRHKNALAAALNDLASGLEGLRKGASEDLIASDLRHAADTLKQITGERVEGDILDRIFERFCIGK